MFRFKREIEKYIYYYKKVVMSKMTERIILIPESTEYEFKDNPNVKKAYYTKEIGALVKKESDQEIKHYPTNIYVLDGSVVPVLFDLLVRTKNKKEGFGTTVDRIILNYSTRIKDKHGEYKKYDAFVITPIDKDLEERILKLDSISKL